MRYSPSRFRVALIVDHPARDLGGLVLTACELCRHGADVYLVPFNLQGPEIAALAPDFVLLNYLRAANLTLASNMDEAGIGFGSLDTEGGVWADPDEFTELFWRDSALLDRVRCACVWGPCMADHIVSRALLSPTQLRVTGCPRFDLYIHPWQAVQHEQPRPREPRILINTNFSVSNPRFLSERANRRELVESAGWSEERYATYCALEQEAIRGMIAIAREVATTFPRCRVLLRPHPFEREEPYLAATTGLANVTVSSAGPVQLAIAGSIAVIQRSCTTGIEAALAGVPTFSPQWVPAPSHIPIAEAVSEPCCAPDDLLGMLATVLAGTYRPSEQAAAAKARVIHDWFHSDDGRAHERVSAAVLEQASLAGRVSYARCRRQLHGLDAPDARGPARAARWLRWRLGLPSYWSFRRMRPMPSAAWTQSNKYFGVEEVRPLVGRIERARREAGGDTVPVRVAAASDSGAYLSPYRGHSVTLRAER